MNIRNVLFVFTVLSAHNVISVPTKAVNPLDVPLQIQNNLTSTVKVKTNFKEYTINAGGFVSLGAVPQEIHVKKLHELYHTASIQQALSFINGELSRVPVNATDITALIVIEPGDSIFHPFAFTYLNHSPSNTGISYRIPR